MISEMWYHSIFGHLNAIANPGFCSLFFFMEIWIRYFRLKFTLCLHQLLIRSTWWIAWYSLNTGKRWQMEMWSHTHTYTKKHLFFLYCLFQFIIISQLGVLCAWIKTEFNLTHWVKKMHNNYNNTTYMQFRMENAQK